MTYSLVVVTGGATRHSVSAMLAEKMREAVISELEKHGDVRVHALHIGKFAYEIAEKLSGDDEDPELQETYEKIYSADGIITVSPVFKASYSGLYKLFWDLTDEDDLTDTPTFIGATGGTQRHSLMLDHTMRPLFGFMGAQVAPTAIYATPEEVTGTDQATLERRVARGAQQFATLVRNYKDAQ